MSAPVAVWFTIAEDWVALCDDSCRRPIHLTSDNWGDAYEAAVGHAAVHHPRRVVVLRETDAPDPLNAATACYLDAAANVLQADAGRQIREHPYLTWIADQIERQSARWAA